MTLKTKAVCHSVFIVMHSFHSFSRSLANKTWAFLHASKTGLKEVFLRDDGIRNFYILQVQTNCSFAQFQGTV